MRSVDYSIGKVPPSPPQREVGMAARRGGRAPHATELANLCRKLEGQLPGLPGKFNLTVAISRKRGILRKPQTRRPPMNIRIFKLSRKQIFVLEKRAWARINKALEGGTSFGWDSRTAHICVPRLWRRYERASKACYLVH